MNKPKNMSQRDRTQKHKDANPADEGIRKEKQRQSECLLRFHIKRNHLYGYGIPAAIDTSSDAFARVREAYLSEASGPVEVVEA